MENSMTLVDQIKSDTLNILLTNQIHKGLTDKARAIKISKVCKVVRDRTRDKTLYDTCKQIISAVSAGRYKDVVKAINLTEHKYFMEYGNA